MTIGSAVRGVLGARLERRVADGYRRLFVDLDAVATTIAALGTFTSVVEVGCGEGALMTRLMDALPRDATGLGIDIAAHPGHAYSGINTDVTFRQTDVAAVAEAGDRFDLVVVSDVLHHIPPPDRRPFLVSCTELVAAGGTIVVKEWVRRRNVAHLAAYTSDRFVSGDRGVSFYDEHELQQLFDDICVADGAPVLRSYSPPHWNNVLLASTPRA